MDAGTATILNPIDELFESQLVSKLKGLIPLIQSDHPIPGVSDKAEFEICLKLSFANFLAALLGEPKVKRF